MFDLRVDLSTAKSVLAELAASAGVSVPEIVEVQEASEVARAVARGVAPVWSKLWPFLNESERRFGLAMVLVSARHLNPDASSAPAAILVTCLLGMPLALVATKLTPAAAYVLLAAVFLGFLGSIYWAMKTIMRTQFKAALSLSKDALAAERYIRKRVMLVNGQQPEEPLGRLGVLSAAVYRLNVPPEYQSLP